MSKKNKKEELITLIIKKGSHKVFFKKIINLEFTIDRDVHQVPGKIPGTIDLTSGVFHNISLTGRYEVIPPMKRMKKKCQRKS